MKRTTIEAAVEYATSLLRNIEEPWKSLAFPVIVTQILQGQLGRSVQASLKAPLAKDVPKAAAKKPTRSGTLRKLIADGWFKTKRRPADIRTELRNRGLPTKSTTLPSLVLPLVLEGKLKRKPVGKGQKEIYVYFS